MTQRTRKLLGVFIIVAVLIAYCVVAVSIHQALISGLPIWAQLIYFAITGIGWAVPAGMIIRWMARPDPEKQA